MTCQRPLSSLLRLARLLPFISLLQLPVAEASWDSSISQGQIDSAGLAAASVESTAGRWLRRVVPVARRDDAPEENLRRGVVVDRHGHFIATASSSESSSLLSSAVTPVEVGPPSTEDEEFNLNSRMVDNATKAVKSDDRDEDTIQNLVECSTHVELECTACTNCIPCIKGRKHRADGELCNEECDACKKCKPFTACFETCADDDNLLLETALQRNRTIHTCSELKGHCDDEGLEEFAKNVCPKTCQECQVLAKGDFSEDCADNDAEFIENSRRAGLIVQSCAQFAKNCSNEVHGMLVRQDCPLTCRICKECKDEDSALVARAQTLGPSFSFTGCKEVAAHCDDKDLGLFARMNCPQTCGICFPKKAVTKPHEEHHWADRWKDELRGDTHSYLHMTKSSRGEVSVSWISPGTMVNTLVATSVQDEHHGPGQVMKKDGKTHWRATSPEAAITFEFLKPMKIGGFRVQQPAEAVVGAFRGYKFLRSKTGFAWTLTKHGTGERQECCNFQSIEFEPVTSKFWKLEVLSTYMDRNVTIGYIEFKVILGQTEGYDIPKLMMCEHEGSFQHHGRCPSQRAAMHVCMTSGLRLCSMYEIEDAIGRVCHFMWTSTSATHAYHVGNGLSNCGLEGKMYSETEGIEGPGMFDAACCIVTTTTTTSKLPVFVVHEAFGTYTFKGKGGCATMSEMNPSSTVRPKIKSVEACRKVCDLDASCGALSWCGQGGGCYGDCHLYPNVLKYTMANSAVDSMQCWIRGGLLVRDGMLSQATTAWRAPWTIVKAVTATSDDSESALKTVLFEDDGKFWKSEDGIKFGQLVFEMIGPQKVSGMRLKMPTGFPGSSMKEYEIEFSLDAKQWSIVKKAKHENQDCCDFATLEWPATTAPWWRINIRTNHGSNVLSLQYIEFLVTTTQSSCSAFIPTLEMKRARADDFLVFANVGAQQHGGIPFGSGSMTMKCDSAGPGIGLRFGLHGENCFHNINDLKEGELSSWMPGEKFNGLHFVGIQLAGHRRIHGFRISTPMKFGGNVGGWYHVQYSGVSYASFNTPDAHWCTIGSFTRDSPGVLYKSFSEPVNASAIRILVSDQRALIDELQVFGEVEALPVSEGLVVDLRAKTYTKGMGVWGNQVLGGGTTEIPKTILFDDGQQAFTFFKGGKTLKLKVHTDPLVLPDATYVAWVRLLKEEETGCVNSNGDTLAEAEAAMQESAEDDVEGEEICVTSGAAGAGAEFRCVFPFWFEGVTYNTCTDASRRGKPPWCAVEVDRNGHVATGKWGECSPASCEVPYYQMARGVPEESCKVSADQWNKYGEKVEAADCMDECDDDSSCNFVLFRPETGHCTPFQTCTLSVKAGGVAADQLYGKFYARACALPEDCATSVANSINIFLKHDSGRKCSIVWSWAVSENAGGSSATAKCPDSAGSGSSAWNNQHYFNCYKHVTSLGNEKGWLTCDPDEDRSRFSVTAAYSSLIQNIDLRQGAGEHKQLRDDEDNEEDEEHPPKEANDVGNYSHFHDGRPRSEPSFLQSSFLERGVRISKQQRVRHRSQTSPRHMKLGHQRPTGLRSRSSDNNLALEEIDDGKRRRRRRRGKVRTNVRNQRTKGSKDDSRRRRRRRRRRAIENPKPETLSRIIAKFSIDNLRFLLLSQNQKDRIQALVKRQVAGMVSLPEESIKVTLTTGVAVSVFIKTPEKIENIVLKSIVAHSQKLSTTVMDATNALPGIEMAKSGPIGVTAPSAYIVPRCAETDTGRGWIMAQTPDFGRSRALVLSDWRGGLSMEAGTMWNSSFGKAPVGKWIFVAGIYRQKQTSFFYYNGKGSLDAVVADNTAAGDYRILKQLENGRCIGTVPRLKDALVFRQNCPEGERRISFYWKEALGSQGMYLLVNYEGKCMRACRDWLCVGNDEHLTKLILDTCKPDDARYQFEKFTVPEGYVQIRQRIKNSNRRTCVRALGNSKQDKAELELGDCAMDDGSLFNEIKRIDTEVLTIGGKEDYDMAHNPQLLVSDVAVYNRALTIAELSKLYEWGRPSVPANVVAHCPPTRDLMGGLCVANEYREFCDYLAKMRLESCEDFCFRQDESICVDSAPDSPLDSCSRGHKGSCKDRREHQVCRCMPKSTETTTTTGIMSDVFAVGRDRLVYRQTLPDMSEITDWQQTAPCCVKSIALTEDYMYGVSDEGILMRIPTKDLSIKSQWQEVGKCCVDSITIDGDDIYAIKEHAVFKQPLKTAESFGDWNQVGRCCVTSIAFDRDFVFVSSTDGQVYTQTRQGMIDGQRWVLKGKGGVNSVQVIGSYLYAAGADNAVYRQELGTITAMTEWTVTGKCCMTHVASLARSQFVNISASETVASRAELPTTTVMPTDEEQVLAEGAKVSRVSANLRTFSGKLAHNRRLRSTTSQTTTYATWEVVQLAEGASAKRCNGSPEDVFSVPGDRITEAECKDYAHTPPVDSGWANVDVRFYQYCTPGKCDGESNCQLVRNCVDVDNQPNRGDWILYVNVNFNCPNMWVQSAVSVRRMTMACDFDNFVVTDELECQETAYKNATSYYQYCKDCEDNHNWCCNTNTECACYIGDGWQWRAYQINPRANLLGLDGDPCFGYDWGEKLQQGHGWLPEYGR